MVIIAIVIINIVLIPEITKKKLKKIKNKINKLKKKKRSFIVIFIGKEEIHHIFGRNGNLRVRPQPETRHRPVTGQIAIDGLPGGPLTSPAEEIELFTVLPKEVAVVVWGEWFR